VAEKPEDKPKFLKFSVMPRHVRLPRSGVNPVKISGVIYTGGDKGPVDIRIIHPNGKVEKLTPAKYAKTRKHWIVNIQKNYGVTQDSKLGKYKAEAVIRANKNQKRVGYFTAK